MKYLMSTVALSCLALAAAGPALAAETATSAAVAGNMLAEVVVTATKS